jgi:HD-like signal output (HDOD) protein
MENYDHASDANGLLPLGTGAAMQLLDLFRDPDHSVDRIVDFISQDPQLTAATLKRCNNAAFRGARPTTDIFEAINRLGYYELYGIVAASLGTRPGPARIPVTSLAPPLDDGTVWQDLVSSEESMRR